MKNIIFGFIVAFLFLNSVSAIAENKKPKVSSAVEFEISLPPPYPILKLRISKLSKLQKYKKDYFNSVTDCDDKEFLGTKVEHIGRCLEFHSRFKKTEWTRVPVQIIKETAGEPAQKQFAWGSATNWSTEGRTHYLILQPKGQNFAVRIGPAPSEVVSGYDFNLKDVEWIARQK